VTAERSGIRGALEETFFECQSGPKWVALVKQNSEHFLSFQHCYVDDGKAKFRNQARSQLGDGAAEAAMDNVAKRVLLPFENKRDLVDVPGDVLGTLQIIFYADPVNAPFRAMGVE